MLQIAKFDLGYLWVKRIVAIFGVIVTAGAAIATGAMLIHGHPAYIVLLAASLVISSAVAVRSWSLLAPRGHVPLSGGVSQHRAGQLV
ncbi:hypothetical protein [Cryobacterium sp. M15]|uniref:hypothetical protein n=1 Tax=Cryobacterium sp. M15 TaxID=2048291 RepID=UPI000CE3F4B9|nr:hypothetical protein [Cryobacterium sp. M15]